MSFISTNPTNLKSVVYASEIKTSDCIFDYINGKGQFYVQNKYFPLGIADKKKAFENSTLRMEHLIIHQLYSLIIKVNI